MDDSTKLRTLAEWFDVQDAKTGSEGVEVQMDLRRIARELSALQAIVDELAQMPWQLLCKLDGQGHSRCVFCGADPSEHKPYCIYARAAEAAAQGQSQAKP